MEGVDLTRRRSSEKRPWDEGPVWPNKIAKFTVSLYVVIKQIQRDSALVRHTQCVRCASFYYFFPNFLPRERFKNRQSSARTVG